MHTHHGEFERIKGVLSEAEQPLTAREITSSLEGHEKLNSSHRVATVLGHYAESGGVTVIRETPYRYRLD
ncbi:hypothetical protein [Haloprofundus halobius]|uniref:hypothetical protein n=1 Tax=Haloprofundus halobius TaxID=2876194 RepID=UPI001CC940A3|nr:hypothetical protein [Haloprofundus halobius]